MILEHPQNISLKINSIQDNIQYLYKDPDTHFKPHYIQNSNISHIHQITEPFFQIYPTNISLEDDAVNKSSINNENTANISELSYIFLNSINSSKNTFEYIPFKEYNDYKYNSYLSNNNSIKNSDLIEPIFPDELYKNKNESEYLVKKKKTFSKFKIEHSKLKQKRKYKPDDIRKKIKSRFHKSIRNIINENLKKAGSKYFFSFLPQIFICSIGREKNYQILNLF